MLCSIIKTSEWTNCRAQEIRGESTRAEKALWQQLRAGRFHGYKFRRQVAVGRYIVDFVCVRKKLIIEVDGDIHWEEGHQEQDRRREEYLRKRGFQIIRFGNQSVLGNMDGVLEALAEKMDIAYE